MKMRDVDQHVGRRLRERRTMLGITQSQLATLIGVTYQQEHKYEKGVNRISAGRLHAIAQALHVGTDYFFMEMGQLPSRNRQTDLLLLRILNLTRNYRACAPDVQVAISNLVRSLAADDDLGAPEEAA